MPPSDHKAVFSNAQAIYTFHANHFLPELEKAHHQARTGENTLKQQQQQQQQQQRPSAMSRTSSLPANMSNKRPSTPSSMAPSATLHSISDEDQTDDVSAINGQQDSDTTVASSGNGTDGKIESSSATMESIKLAGEDRIGKVFADHVAYMKMYSFYINNFDNALRVLQTQLTQAKYKKKMKEFLRRCAKHPNHTQLGLQGYLLLPVQRIPRYKLLLTDLLENTWPDHVDYQDIASALEKISSRADEMNERKRQYENHEKVLLIQNRIIGQHKAPLVQPHRKVVREGMLHLIRIVTRNVAMGVDNKVVPVNAPIVTSRSLSTAANLVDLRQTTVAATGDHTIHYLSEETVEKSFLFILFNDILIQCNTIAGKNAGGSGSSGQNANNSNSTINQNGGATSIHGSSSSIVGANANGTGAAASGSSDTAAKNLELCRILQLESRLHPAEVIGQDVLRVVDDTMVLYLTGDKDVIQAWKDDINSRW
ncbi:Dbl homology domain-containing protein [Lobosporangium transversale]|uniref:Dbl homology domain-containing protein n=1 Tax=Lobosporangium transversale TaxID=64571 RepID=A0A1Y2GKI8_9FUNG|nr:Dbl homology domain-containing protein [Lobosporangium transversale]ORZ13816.1 Dbl homology domain-containing protein [Lobosporangium transversale]|eukprot:XP_021880600.1 Dbl homology domain-containing protein [Lobosporangium transversale]